MRGGKKRLEAGRTKKGRKEGLRELGNDEAILCII